MNAERRQFVCDQTRSRRLLLKRVAILGAALLAPAILGASGCATTSDGTRKKGGFISFDHWFLGDRPGEETE